MRSRPVLLTAIAVAAVVATGASAVILTRPEPPHITVTVSSTQAGTSAGALVEVARSTPDPTAAYEPSADPSRSENGEPPTPPEGAVTWSADEETEGAWVALAWEEPTPVNRIRVDGAGDGFSSALVTFDDGGSVFLTPDRHGDVLVDMPERTVTEATLTFVEVAEGADAVALEAFVIDQAGNGTEETARSTATGSSGSVAHSAVTDGDIGQGELGEVWRADGEPAWIAHTWDSPVSVSSVQIAGATYGNSAPGTLVFSDGSSVAVAGVSAGSEPVTTVAFTPRTVSWVRLDLDSSSTAIGEFRAYGPGTTPPVWPSSGGIDTTAPAADDCGNLGAPVGSSQESALALVCPATGTRVGDQSVVVVSGPAGQMLTASAWVADADGDGGGIAEIDRVLIAEDGLARLELDTTRLLAGPFAIRLEVPGSDVPLYVQLVNAAGTADGSDGHAPAGMTLQFEDDFDDPLSVTWDGRSSRYAGTKPAGEGGSEFGGAVFLDPAHGRDLLSTMDGHLRIRAEPLDGVDPWNWDRQYASGLLSSTHVGGAGFSAQYGYFEARILGPAGRGTWPAFWMLDTESAIRPEGPSGEVDAVELYGHDPASTCHTLHNWPLVEREEAGPHCGQHIDGGDWALEWHTFGVRVRPGGADFFIDGEHVKSEEGLLRHSLPYYFMLNLAVDGGWPVMLDPTGGTADLYVDWVRVYS